MHKKLILVLRTLLISGAVFALALLLLPNEKSAPHVTASGPEQYLVGWAWGGSVVPDGNGGGSVGGIGWISFHCLNTDSTCAPGKSTYYGVTKNEDDTLTGYAWTHSSPSEHPTTLTGGGKTVPTGDGFGWIQFGGLTGFPTGPGTISSNVKIDTVNGQLGLVGWARLVDAGSGTDNWDGWISFHGTGYGVNIVNGYLNGYAWGGPNVGWIHFDDNCTDDCPIDLPPPEVCTEVCFVDKPEIGPWVDLTVNDKKLLTITDSHAVNIRWASNDVVSCKSADFDTDLAGGDTTSYAGNSITVTPTDENAPTEYSIECTASDDSTVTDTVAVSIDPTYIEDCTEDCTTPTPSPSASVSNCTVSARTSAGIVQEVTILNGASRRFARFGHVPFTGSCDFKTFICADGTLKTNDGSTFPGSPSYLYLDCKVDPKFEEG